MSNLRDVSRLPAELSADWQLSPDTIKPGAQGEIVPLIAKQGHQTAVLKRLKAAATEQAQERFRREVEVLTTIQHEHVVPVIARDYSSPPTWYLMPRGDLFPEHWKNKRHELKDDPAGLFDESKAIILAY